MLFMVAVYNLSITRLGPLKAIIRIDGGGFGKISWLFAQEKRDASIFVSHSLKKF